MTPALKPAFKKDTAFLEGVQTSLATRQTKLWWLGQSGFLLTSKGRALLLDPYLSDSLTRKYATTDKPHVRMTERVVAPDALAQLGAIDLITSSHLHTDHFDPETLAPILSANPKAKLVIPAANRQNTRERLPGLAPDRFVELDAGETTAINDIVLHGIPAAHNTVERDENGHCRFLGYVLQLGNLTIYHSGDTLWHDGLVSAVKPFKVTLALLPINGDKPERRVAGNLDGVQAARLAYQIHAGMVVPCHFDMFEFNTASPSEFVSECEQLGQRYRVLGQGEGLTL